MSRKRTSDMLESPAPLDVDAVEPVDQDVADGRVLQQRLQRAQAERLIHDLVHELFLLGEARAGLSRIWHSSRMSVAHLLANDVRRQRAEVLHVQPLDKLLVDAHLHLLEVDLALGLLSRLLHATGGAATAAICGGDAISEVGS